jgi:hypothetical protein
MTPFHEIKKVPAMKVAAWRGDVSMWGIDTAFSRLYDRAMEQKLLFRQPAVGIRHGGVRVPEPFHADYEIMFPLTADPGREVPGIDVKDLPGQEVATREVFFVAPEPHSGGTQDDMLTEIQVPIRPCSSDATGSPDRRSIGGQIRSAA